jgi:CRISPR-associated protein Cmr3
MFRGPGEFDPYTRGTYSRALTLILPTPSTVAGSLATYCISKLNKSLPTSDDWIERYSEVLGDLVIRGPLLSLDGELMVEDKCLDTLLSIREVREKCLKEYERFKEIKNIYEIEKQSEPKKFESRIEIERDVRIGIGLEMRDKRIKTTKEGYLYATEYIDFRNLKREKKNIIAEILADIKGNLVKELSVQRPVSIKLGGEMRATLLSFQEGNCIFSKIKKELWYNGDIHKGLMALYVATPVLVKGGKRVDEFIKEWSNKGNYSFKGISGESEPLGAGYSLGESKRKPVYISLKSGSIIYLKGEFELSRIYWEQTIGEATKIGYGTLIPVPLKI